LSDIRVIQAREHGAFAPNSIREATIGPLDRRDLQRDLPLDRNVNAIGEPNDGHAAAAQFAHQLIWPNAIAGFRLNLRTVSAE
jgi:hypothetical protein